VYIDYKMKVSKPEKHCSELQESGQSCRESLAGSCVSDHSLLIRGRCRANKLENQYTTTSQQHGIVATLLDSYFFPKEM